MKKNIFMLIVRRFLKLKIEEVSDFFVMIGTAIAGFPKVLWTNRREILHWTVVWIGIIVGGYLLLSLAGWGVSHWKFFMVTLDGGDCLMARGMFEYTFLGFAAVLVLGVAAAVVAGNCYLLFLIARKTWKWLRSNWRKATDQIQRESKKGRRKRKKK